MEGYPNNYHVTEDGQYVTTRQSLLNGTMAINIQNSQLAHQIPNRNMTGLGSGNFVRNGAGGVMGAKDCYNPVASKFGAKSNYFMGSVPITANRSRPHYNYSLAPNSNNVHAQSTLFPGIHFQPSSRHSMNSRPASVLRS